MDPSTFSQAQSLLRTNLYTLLAFNTIGVNKYISLGLKRSQIHRAHFRAQLAIYTAVGNLHTLLFGGRPSRKSTHRAEITPGSGTKTER